MDSTGTILILGGSSFVGLNLIETLKDNPSLHSSTRKTIQGKGQIFFDYGAPTSWENVLAVQPKVIINCIGYGVLSHEKDLQATLEVNYLQATRFYQFLSGSGFSGQLIHIGSSFEYDMEEGGLYEHSRTLPRSSYGISKLMATKFLLETKLFERMTVLRPFNLFGPFENDIRLLPSLIRAQVHNVPMPLTAGTQRRDFVYVRDFTAFVKHLISLDHSEQVPELMNVGNGVTYSVRELADLVSHELPVYNDELWQWNGLPQRAAEGAAFFNASGLAYQCGYRNSELQDAVKETVAFYRDKYKMEEHVAG